VRIPILHLVLLLKEVLANHVFQLIVRPAAVRVAALAKLRLRLKGTVLELRSDLANKL
jgi:hypothetical protein